MHNSILRIRNRNQNPIMQVFLLYNAKLLEVIQILRNFYEINLSVIQRKHFEKIYFFMHIFSYDEDTIDLLN